MKLSKLGMGAMRLPTDENGIDHKKAEEIIDYVYKNGVNYFDTAYIYHGGESEVFLGKALAKYPRDSYYIADKFNATVNPDYAAQFAEQLSRLNSEHIDFYMYHGVQDVYIEKLAASSSLEYFESQKAESKIKNLGFSFHGTPDGLRRMFALRNWDFVMLQLNYFDWLYGEGKTLYDIASAKNIPIMVMEPLRGGKLAELTPEAAAVLKEADPHNSIASWFMRWLMTLPDVSVVLSGMTTLDQAQDNINTFFNEKPLNENQQAILKKACGLYRPTVAVACTDCRYCTDDCPQNLDIPRLVGIYNEVKFGGMWRVSFLNALSKNKRPKDCTACSLCVERCPQNLDVPGYFKELADICEQNEIRLSSMKKETVKAR